MRRGGNNKNKGQMKKAGSEEGAEGVEEEAREEGEGVVEVEDSSRTITEKKQ